MTGPQAFTIAAAATVAAGLILAAAYIAEAQHAYNRPGRP